jgi:peptide/nickel transport system substrate-binding protein
LRQEDEDMSEIDYWKDQVVRARITRREFLERAAALGVSTALATRMLAKAGIGAEPKPGGKFRVGTGHGSTTDSLDPGTWENAFTVDIGVGLIGAELVAIDQKNNVVPALAESFEPSDDAKSWRYKLRKGVTFHNGKSLISHDVVATYNYHRGEGSKSAVKSALSTIVDVKADGPDTVIFTLSEGSADFHYISSDYHLPIFPSTDGKIDWASGVGAGPYILQKFEPGVRANYKRNPNYFGTTYFDEVEQLVIGDVTARTDALIAGEIDFIDRCDLKTVGLLKRNPDLGINNYTGFGHYAAPMNVTVPPFDNVDVRKAIKYSFDREELVKKVLFGYGTPGNDDPIAPSIRFATQPEPIYEYDPDKAKFHLGKAGLSSLKVDLSAADAAFVGAVDAAILMKEHAARIGIDINVIREPNDGYWNNVWMKKPWTMSVWLGRPTVDWMMTTAYAADATWNDTFWKHPRFNELLAAARAETDAGKRAGMYAEMQQILHDDGGVLVLMFNNYVEAHSKRVVHGELNSNYEHDGGQMYRRWWFA